MKAVTTVDEPTSQPSDQKPQSVKRKREKDTLVNQTKRHKASPEKESKSKAGPVISKYELVCVVNRSHKQEVDQKVHVRQVNDENSGFPHVRRNKKIQKVLDLPHRKIVLSSKQGLHTIPKKFQNQGVYDTRVLHMIDNPAGFQVKPKSDEDFAWTITSTPNGEDPCVLMTDFSETDLTEMHPDLEKDMGIITTAVDQLLTDSKPDVAPLTTHPGHHAGPNKIANYCVLNNGILAASMIKKNKPQYKIGLLDIDAHPGDGTLSFVTKNSQLLERYVSLHTDVEFSNMKTFKGPNHAVVMKRSENAVGRPRQIPWKEYNQKLQQILKSFRSSELNVLVVCVGFDTLKDDPIAGHQVGYQLYPAHFQKIGLLLGQEDYQVLFIQEGGYDPNLTADAFDNLLKGFYTGRQTKAINGL